MKRRGLAQALLIALLLAGMAGVFSGVSGCALRQSNVIIDWVNFIRFGGITYLASYHAGRDLQPGDLGEQFATVRASLANNVHDPKYQTRDGDASYLAAGTPIYRVRGYAATFRLAAEQAGGIMLFEADTNPRAKTGADLLEIAGKVRSITLTDTSGQAISPLAMIQDARQVAALTAQLLAAPVDQSRDRSTGTRYILTLQLADGTQVYRAYFPEGHEVECGILVPDAFVSALASAMSA